MNIVRRFANILISYRDNFPPKERELLKLYGTYKIRSITVIREPIMREIDTVLNLISFGKWQQAKEDSKYDKMFHLYAVLDVYKENDTAFIKIEKNEVIRMATTFSYGKNTQYQIIRQVPNDLTVDKLMSNMLKKYPKTQIFRYNPWNANCQNFIIMLLEASNLLTEQLKQFIQQDMSTIISKMPQYAQYLSSSVTDLAHKLNIVAEGYGFTKK